MEAWTLHMSGIVSIQLEDYPAADDAFRHALRHFDEAGDLTGQALVVDDFATLALAVGDKERGIRLWAAARRIQETIGTGLVKAQIDSSGQPAWRRPRSRRCDTRSGVPSSRPRHARGRSRKRWPTRPTMAPPAQADPAVQARGSAER